MPGKREIRDEAIIHCLRSEYGLEVKSISSLSLGADVNTSVYRLITRDQTSYFLKLRKGYFNEAAVTIPNFLSSLGIKQVIPPLPTQKGQLWTNIHPFTGVLYPFVEGHAGLDQKMSREQWFEFGRALKRFHTTDIPHHLTNSIQRDKFSSRWRDLVKLHLERMEEEVFNEHVKLVAADFLKSKKTELLEVLKRTEQLGLLLQKEALEFILCHSDIHGYNLLIDNNGALYIVDWDALILAPKERDLMFIGGGHGNSGYTPEEEEAMFYQGYGHISRNQIAIAYYRYDRIMMDIADDCDLIFLSDQGEEDRTAAFEDLTNKFLPGSYLEIAYQSDKVLKK